MTSQGHLYPPHILAGALSIVLERIEGSPHIPDSERQHYITAAMSAFTYLFNRGAWQRDGDAILFPSRSRRNLRHRCSNRHCTCEAGSHGRICFHRPAKKLIELVEAFQTDLHLPPGRPPVASQSTQPWQERRSVPSLSGQPAA